MGGEENYDFLQKEKSGSWSCGKKTKKEDLLLIYLIKPVSAIVATAIASSDAKPHKKWRFIANIKNIKIIKPPVTLAEMRQRIPESNWVKNPRSPIYYVPKDIVSRLPAKLKRKLIPELSDKIISSAGAGFGTPEQNRAVEKAACKAVRLYYLQKGFKVVSREKENLGYDFDVNRDTKKLHVEVKGISGSITKFIITAKEANRANADSKFRLAAVTEAMTELRRTHIFTGKEFLKKFELISLAYYAEVKQNLSA